MAGDLINNPELMQKTVLNREWLSRRTKDELQRIIVHLTKEIATNLTSKLGGVPDQLKQLEFVPVKIKNVETFTRLPLKADTALTEDTKKVILVIPDSHYQPIGIEIVRSIVLGRGKEADNVDLDLTDYDAGGLGVSRRHAILQTIAGNLYLVDSGSTNGTYLNGKKLSVLEPNRVEDDDIISLGGFHFKVMIYQEEA